MPLEAEARGLLALLFFLQARKPARRDPHGNYVPLSEQDPRLWNAELIHRAELTLRQASTLRKPGRFQIEAAIQSAHCARFFGDPVNWPAIVTLYDRLFDLTQSNVVAINRAIAMVQVGPAELAFAALPPEDELLKSFQPYHAARAELLTRMGRNAEAAQALRSAIALESDDVVRRHLQALLKKRTV